MFSQLCSYYSLPVLPLAHSNIQTELIIVDKMKSNLLLKIIRQKCINKNYFINVAVQGIVCKFKNILAAFLSGGFSLNFSKAVLFNLSLACALI